MSKINKEPVSIGERTPVSLKNFKELLKASVRGSGLFVLAVSANVEKQSCLLVLSVQIDVLWLRLHQNGRGSLQVLFGSCSSVVVWRVGSI
jgi:hypothetical protein